MNNNIIAVFVALALASPSLAKTFDRCSLIREMKKVGVAQNDLARWACIAERESSFRTDAIGPDKENGLFQISPRYWCKPASGQSSNGCNVSCSELLSDDITASVKCAQVVLKEQGWSAWSTNRYCSGSLPSINECF